jgi:hypothetical protein
MMKEYFSFALLILVCIFAPTSQAEDRIELQGTTVVGNRELPKVLYIVPWKKANSDNLMGNPVANLVGDSLAPIDRDVFRREVEYYDRLSVSKTADPASAE